MRACFGMAGCGEESPIAPDETVPKNAVVRAVANLVSTVPMAGEEAVDTRPVTLFFDKTPLAVTVNNTPAVINRKQAKWTIPRNIDDGSQLLHIFLVFKSVLVYNGSAILWVWEHVNRNLKIEGIQ